MPSVIDGYNYDIFISCHQKDNKGDRWVSQFVEAFVEQALKDVCGIEGFVGVTAQEMLEMMNGSHAQISGSCGCTSKMVLDGNWIVVTVSKND